MNGFFLSPSLKNSTHFIHDLKLCKVFLNDDARFPWLILVPKINDVSEVFDLSFDQRHLLMDEVSTVSSVLKKQTKADKINIAAFGNITRQLHIHIIARFETDAYWPQSVIGAPNPITYDQSLKDEMLRLFRFLLNE